MYMYNVHASHLVIYWDPLTYAMTSIIGMITVHVCWVNRLCRMHIRSIPVYGCAWLCFEHFLGYLGGELLAVMYKESNN